MKLYFARHGESEAKGSGGEYGDALVSERIAHT
jgi:broad specificity phosphatase PhoE